MMEITIELVDKRHIIARSKIFKNGAEVYQFRDEKEARKELSSMLKMYKKEGYVSKIEAKDAHRLRKI